jgi:hypothetical protein
MPGYVVFVRFFLGYTESFPFDRFTHLKDDAIGNALEALRKEWWRKPANRQRIRAERDEQRRQQKELEQLQEDWLQGAVARPGWNPGLPAVTTSKADDALAKRVDDAPAQHMNAPSFEEIAAAAGWWNRTGLDAFPFDISRRYPVARFDSKRLAEDAAAALQEKVAELARGAYAKEHWNDDEDNWLATANPRFAVVAEKSLSGGELAVVRERLQKLGEPVGKHPTLEEGLGRFYLVKLHGTLEQIGALNVPENVAVKPSDAPLMASAASSKTSTQKTPQREPLEKEPPCYDVHVRSIGPDALKDIAKVVARKNKEPNPNAAGNGTAGTLGRQPTDKKTRPPHPTPEYCLLVGYKVRWDVHRDPVKLKPQLWNLLDHLLKQSNYPIEVSQIEDLFWPQGTNKKTLPNRLSDLANALLPIAFPWTWGIKDGHVHRDG